MKKMFIMIISIVSLYAGNNEITLNDAIKTALENNKQAKISKIALDIAKVQYEQALSANYPAINAMIVGQRKKEDVIYQQRGDISLPADTVKSLTMANLLANGMPLANAQAYIASLPAGAFENQTLSIDTDTTAYGRDTVRGSVNIVYPLFTGGKISSVIEQAKLNKLLSVNKVTRTQEDVVYDIKKYFYGYVLTNELHKIANNSLKRMEFISTLTKQFYEGGLNLNKQIIFLFKSL